MSRGGRGGANSFVPFDVDTALEDQVAAYRDQDDSDGFNLYPPMKVHKAPSPTAYEKKLVNIARRHRTAMRNGPFFMDEPKAGKRDAAEFNAFEDVATYGNKKAKRSGGLPNLKKVPIVKDVLPRELWDMVSDGEEENGESTKKNLDFLKKRRLDKLAQFDEGADIQAPADDDAANDDEIDEEDRVTIPEDDDFSEDESDLGNDYNAEKYFDDGDGVDDDGDDAGGGDEWERERYTQKVDAEVKDRKAMNRAAYGRFDPRDSKARASEEFYAITFRTQVVSGQRRQPEIGVSNAYEIRRPKTEKSKAGYKLLV